MALLDQVVYVFPLADSNLGISVGVGIERGQRSSIGSTLIDGDFRRSAPLYPPRDTGISTGPCS